MFEMRQYQKEAIQEARLSLKRGNKNICLCLATGAGKSPIAREIISLFREKNPAGRIAYLTFRTILVEQMKKTLKGLDIEIDTLQAKGKKETELYDLVLIDESHYANNSKLQNNINAKFKIGLSATPITPDGYALPYDEILDIIQLRKLTDLGYASPLKVLSMSKVETSTLKTRAGDFDTKQAYELMSKSTIKKDIVDIYKKYAEGLRTIVYCVNIKHAEELKEEFLNAGVVCDSVHSKNKDSVKALESFKNGSIDLLINVDTLTTGLDLPDIYCLILATPTKSLIKSTQIYGRVSRLDPRNQDKKGLIIDCANVIRDTQHPYQEFDFTKQKKEKYHKCKMCNKKMLLINREVQIIDKYEYVVISSYKCECGYRDEVDTPKIVNIENCEGCNEPFESVGGMKINKESKNLTFNLVCSNCGHKKPFREIIYTDDELKEIKLEDAYTNSATWEDVKIILRVEAKKASYHHRWVNRALDTFKKKNLEPKQAIQNIKTTLGAGRKLANCLFI